MKYFGDLLENNLVVCGIWIKQDGGYVDKYWSWKFIILLSLLFLFETWGFCKSHEYEQEVRLAK